MLRRLLWFIPYFNIKIIFCDTRKSIVWYQKLFLDICDTLYQKIFFISRNRIFIKNSFFFIYQKIIFDIKKWFLDIKKYFLIYKKIDFDINLLKDDLDFAWRDAYLYLSSS